MLALRRFSVNAMGGIAKTIKAIGQGMRQQISVKIGAIFIGGEILSYSLSWNATN